LGPSADVRLLLLLFITAIVLYLEESVGSLVVAASYLSLRHVSVSDCGHGDDGPPEAVGNGLEVRVRRAGLGEVDRTREENHA
jgi:hypothetical protein